MYEKLIEFIKANSQTILVILLLVVIIDILSLIICRLIRKFAEKVEHTSKRIEALKQLNSKYFFHDVEDTIYYNDILYTKTQFDRYNFDKHLQEIIESQMEFYDEIIEKVKGNSLLYDKYILKLLELPAVATNEDVRKHTHFATYYRKVEEKLYNNIVFTPVVSFKIIFTIKYTTPKGRYSYEDYITYLYDDVLWHVDTVKQKILFRDSKEYQRKVMTDSLRYDILKRDEFKCVICGYSAKDGVKLHVDHIIPVSKGGKTVSSNLRTLCDKCNMGKRDKFDENGIN